MSRSPRTLELYQAAHSLGDEYYRLVSEAIRAGGDTYADCRPLGLSYREALVSLRDHLAGLEESDEHALHIESAEKYIEMLEKDIHHHVSILSNGPFPADVPQLKRRSPETASLTER